MKYISFKMKPKPGLSDEYMRRYKEIWPELNELLIDAGPLEYSIWLNDEANILFAIQKVRDAHQKSRLANEPIIKMWWQYMADLMKTNEGCSPIAVELKEMFFS